MKKQIKFPKYTPHICHLFDAFGGEQRVQVEDFKVNQAVVCNGHEGAVTEVCVGQLDGMYIVRLDAGEVCVSGSELR